MSDTRPARSRRVLMILYFFPPLGGVAMARNISNVTHLRTHGWKPIVLTPRNPAGEPRDVDAVALIPADVEVIRTASVEAGHVRQVIVRARRLLLLSRQAARKGVDRSRTGKSSGSTPRDIKHLARSRSSSLGLSGLRRRIFFPDDEIGWLPFAVVSALRRYGDNRYDAVFSSSSPMTSHLVAGLVKRLTGVPWVAEFRDPWLGNILAPKPGNLRLRAQATVERWIVHTADTVICVTPTLARLYQERYPNVERIVTIPNGYDRAQIADLPSRASRSDRFTIVHAGTLYRPAELRIFLEGLERLVARRPELVGRLDVLFLGTVGPACQQLAAQAVASGRLGGVVRFEDFVPRRVALAAVATADAALVLLGPGPGMDLFVGGKMYEYIGQDKQILAMVPVGDARDLLGQLDWGIVASPEPGDVERAVERLLDTPPPTRRADPEGLFDRAILAGRLADCLDAAASSASASRRGRRRSAR